MYEYYVNLICACCGGETEFGPFRTKEALEQFVDSLPQEQITDKQVYREWVSTDDLFSPN